MLHTLRFCCASMCTASCIFSLLLCASMCTVLCIFDAFPDGTKLHFFLTFSLVLCSEGASPRSFACTSAGYALPFHFFNTCGTVRFWIHIYTIKKLYLTLDASLSLIAKCRLPPLCFTLNRVLRTTCYTRGVTNRRRGLDMHRRSETVGHNLRPYRFFALCSSSSSM